MSNPQLLSGARGVIQRYNPETQTFESLAFATDININARSQVRQTYVVGRMNAGAIDTLSYDVDVSVGRVVPVNAHDAAFDPKGNPGVVGRESTATAIGLGLETVVAQMVSAGDLNIAIQDKVTGKYIASIKGCRYAGRTFNATSGDIANERINFVGIYDAGYDNENAATDGYGL